MFITFEGCDGAGKSSILERIYKQLQKEGIPVVRTREPGGSLLGEKIRALLLHKNKDIAIGTRAELLLFLAARAQHVEELILPELDKGKVVLCDRFHDSTIAYQAFARGALQKAEVTQEVVENLCLFSSSSLQPNCTLLFDVDPKVGLQRSSNVVKKEASKGMLDRIEDESMEFHVAVRNAFLLLAKKNPERIVVINAEESFHTVYNHALAAVQRVLAV